MKILHVTNIAQNAYINSLVLNRAGHECDVLAFDLYHFACSPEWYELFQVDAPPDMTKNPFFPDFYSLNHQLPVISDHVAQGPLFNAMVYLDLRRRGHPLAETAFSVLRYLRFKCTMLQTTLPFSLRWSSTEFEACLSRYHLPDVLRQSIWAGRMVDEVIEYVRSRLMRFSSRAAVMQLSVPVVADLDSPLEAAMTLDPQLNRFVTSLRANDTLYALGLEAPANMGDPHGVNVPIKGDPANLEGFQYFGGLWRRLHAAYDVTIFYGDSSMFAAANGILHYCALEHGTIRAIPFEESAYGQLVRLGYQSASKVFITNTDYITSSRKLEFDPGQVVYLPHPFDEKLAFDFKSKFSRVSRASGIVTFLCPARQDWVSRDSKMAKGNDAIFLAARQLVDQGISNFRLKCIAWGTDLQASIDLCAQLGISDLVSWIPPLTKRQLWEEMLSNDCVIDQFLISVISGVTFEALALGTRLISRDDGVCNREFFGKSPPILSATTPDDIAARMRQVIADPDDDAGIGQACMEWVAERHSAARNTALQTEAFLELLRVKKVAIQQ